MNINVPIVAVCVAAVLILLVVFRKRPDYIINFFLRVGLCFVAIYFLNQAFLEKGISLCVAMNVVTFLTCGILGFPGLFLLYGIQLWCFFVGI